MSSSLNDHITTESDLRRSATSSLDKRRTQSCSPLKNRHSLPTSYSDFNLPLPSQDDTFSLKSLSSSGSIQDQLKILSHSPISRRLQISDTNKYVIPIPFTLQLPPKLSPKNNQCTNKISDQHMPLENIPKSKSIIKPTRLFYTGRGYDKVESDSDSEGKFKGLHRPVNFGPLKSQSKNQDVLSIIEESSSSEKSSRYTSMKSGLKDSVSSPLSISRPVISIKEGAPRILHNNNDAKSTSDSEQMNIIHRTPPYPSNEISLDTKFDSAFDPKIMDNDNRPQPLEKKLTKFYGVDNFANTTTESQNFESRNLQGLSSSLSKVTTNGFPKRKVTANNGNNFAMPSYFISNRNSSNASSILSSATESSVSSGSSMGSLQKSIDITYRGADSSLSYESVTADDKFEGFPNSFVSSSLHSKLDIESEEEQVEPLKIKKATSNEQNINNVAIACHKPNEEKKSKSSINNTQILDLNESIQDETPNHKISDDNEGIGKDFSFPNNSENITNSSEARRRLEYSSSHNSHLSWKYKSRSGQIEIPDLNEELADTYSHKNSTCAPNGVAFNDIHLDNSLSTDTESETDRNVSKLEPIGIPTKAAQRVFHDHLKILQNGSDTDTDTDTDSCSNKKNTLYTNPSQLKSNPCLTTNKVFPSASPNPQVTVMKKSPIRHARHKSMIDIDFDIKSISPTKSSHNKAKSVDFKSYLDRPLPVLPISQNNIPNTSNHININVEEPPRPVRYPIDFKEANNEPLLSSNYVFGLPSSKAASTKIPFIHKLENFNHASHHSESFLYNYNPKQSSYLDDSSSAISSYQSSRSAKESNTTDPSDTESVVIDLTEDQYDICMIKRSNSTASYKSITERNKEGKEIEVVLVDENDTSDADELASIYSKYKNNWVFRRDSTNSNTSSNMSTASFNSKARSESQIRLKPKQDLIQKNERSQEVLEKPSNGISSHLRSQRSNYSSTSNRSLNSSYKSNRIQLPIASMNSRSMKLSSEKSSPQLNLNENHRAMPKYFDYTSSPSYDFSSYMRNKTDLRP